MQCLNLCELPWKWEYYTWSNKQQGANRVFSRIDRAIENDEWMNTFGHMEVDYKMPFISDHAPMIITLRRVESSGKIPFKFFNVWADHEDILLVVEGVWQTQLHLDTMKDIRYKLKALRLELKQLNNNEFRGVTTKIEHLRYRLQDTKEQLNRGYSDAVALEEKKLLEELKRWSLIEENILQQKSRAKWIKLGDSNTKYFSVVMKERSHKKVIAKLTNAFGDRLTDQKEFQQETIAFYKSLMGSRLDHLPAMNKERMKLGPVFTHYQQVSLYAVVTDQEIFEALCAIGDDKAPGVDGYNALFFKRT
ncbi:PREDICTED: uncharacterized protein LOC109208104 [Nicotiana attenuata]|uniref:uncharacterized protein LOC109208104 n=1 Tax=Nicotiana attenuata TaxID=49451 RepID=UPI0009049EF1|nr:PREDICTED: uncharacterized protein LOC109208104 [Nicotiana attenuata]